MRLTGFFISQQENAILTMELRNYFSLYCLHQETQLIHIYLPLTSHILGAFVNSQIQGHKEVSSSFCLPSPKWKHVFAFCFALSQIGAVLLKIAQINSGCACTRSFILVPSPPFPNVTFALELADSHMWNAGYWVVDAVYLLAGSAFCFVLNSNYIAIKRT